MSYSFKIRHLLRFLLLTININRIGLRRKVLNRFLSFMRINNVGHSLIELKVFIFRSLLMIDFSILHYIHTDDACQAWRFFINQKVYNFPAREKKERE